MRGKPARPQPRRPDHAEAFAGRMTIKNPVLNFSSSSFLNPSARADEDPPLPHTLHLEFGDLFGQLFDRSGLAFTRKIGRSKQGSRRVF